MVCACIMAVSASLDVRPATLSSTALTRSFLFLESFSSQTDWAVSSTGTSTKRTGIVIWSKGVSALGLAGGVKVLMGPALASAASAGMRLLCTADTDSVLSVVRSMLQLVAVY